MDQVVFVTANGDRLPLKIDCWATRPTDLMALVVTAATDRLIPFEGRIGLVGRRFKSGQRFGVEWTLHPKMQDNMLCLYHVDAIYPPAHILEPEAIIYGVLGK